MLAWLGRVVGALEDNLLVLLVAATVALAAVQIAGRNFFDTGFPWIDPLLRILVLWVGLVGAMVASRNRAHISIDIVSRYLPRRGRAAAQSATAVFTAAVCGALSYYSYRFVVLDYEFGTRAFAAVPAWTVELILPLGFAVIGLRYLAGAVRGLAEAMGWTQ